MNVSYTVNYKPPGLSENPDPCDDLNVSWGTLWMLMNAPRPALTGCAHLEWRGYRSSPWEKAGGGELGHSFQSVTSQLQPPSSKNVLSF